MRHGALPLFCLSAYLITGILLAEKAKVGSVSLRSFYLRRILRIWPLYTLGLLLGIAWAWVNHLPEWGRLAAYVFFAGNIFCAAYGWSANPLTPLWSISLEEQFYLIWPWAMCFLSRRGLWFASLFFLLVANATIFRLGGEHADTDTTVWANTLVQFEMFATGIILALSGTRSSSRAKSPAVSLIVAGPILWLIACLFLRVKRPAWAGTALNGPALVIGYAMIAFGCAAVMHGICAIDSSHLPKWTSSLGKISYGLYVYHLLIIGLVSEALRRTYLAHSWAMVSLISLSLTILAAKASCVLLESPFLRLKRRFEILHTRPI